MSVPGPGADFNEHASLSGSGPQLAGGGVDFTALCAAAQMAGEDNEQRRVAVIVPPPQTDTVVGLPLP